MTKSQRPQDYTTCENCGKVVSRETVKKGPKGLRLGPECYRKIVARSG